MSQIAIDASEHSIKSVTIFSSRKAEVIRNFTVNLENGHNEVKISTLPSSIDTESARVTGLGDAVLFDVVCAVSDDTPPSADKRSDALKALERKKALLESEKSVRGHEADMLAQFGYTLDAGHNNTSNAESFLDKFVDRARTILRDSAKIDEEICEIDKEIAQEKHREAQKRKRAPTFGQVTAVIMAKISGPIQLTLTYMVSGVQWTPTYDLRASSVGGKPPKTVTLHYRADIIQNTGEDWKNANMSLSTARPGIFTGLPVLRSLRIVPLASGFSKTNNAFPSIFTQQAQQRAPTSLFGQTQTQQQTAHVPPPSSGFGSAFGGFGQTARPTTTGFGATPTASTGSQFGASNGGGLFGSTATPNLGGLFGSIPSTNANSNATSAGLFGSSTALPSFTSNAPLHGASPSPSTGASFNQSAPSLFSFASTGGTANPPSQTTSSPFAAFGTTTTSTNVPQTASSSATGANAFGSTNQQGGQNQTDDSWTTVDAISGTNNQDFVQEGLGEDVSTGLGSWSSTTTSVTESAVASSFRIDGLCSIPSDNSSHKVTVAVLPFEADVHYVSVPRTTPVAFLQCSVTNTSEYRLLRGQVNVYMDESPVSKTYIPDVNPEEMFKCTLGPDPSLRIKLIRLPRIVTTVGSAFTAQTTSASYKYRLFVQNTHAFSVRNVILRDSVPLPSVENNANSQIKVVLKEPYGLSEAAAGVLVNVKDPRAGSNSSAKVRWEHLTGDKDGRFEWVMNIDAGEEVKVESEYEVRAPSDFKWTLQESLSTN